MTQITSYATLQSVIADYLNRTDLTEQIKLFIQLAEQDLRRNLFPYPLVIGRTLTAGQDSFALMPGELESIRLDTDSYKHPITIVSPAALAGLRRDGSGVPFYGAIVSANLMLFDVEVDSAYDVEEVYKPTFTALSDSSSNLVLTRAPDAYLYGALKEAAPFLEHDERNPMWAAKYQKAVDDENLARERALYGEGIVLPRLPIQLG